MNTIELPTVTLPRGTVTMRRLGFDDIGTLTALCQRPLRTWQARKASSLTEVSLTSPEGMLSFFLIALEESFSDSVTWLGSLLGLSPEEVRDPTQVPIHLLPEIIAKAARHPELRDFMESLAAIGAKFKEAESEVVSDG